MERTGYSIRNIRYANCWEDCDILLEASQSCGESKNVLSILSGGDNSFSLLMLNPKRIYAVDFCAEQTFLAKLKMAAIKQFDREKALSFLGINHYSSRKALFGELKTQIDPVSREFWESNIGAIEEGLIHCGRFERYFQYFRRFLVPFLFPKRRIERLFEEMSPHERYDFYYNCWNTDFFKGTIRLFFNRNVMAFLGRDPSFFKYVDGSVSRRVKERLDLFLSADAPEKNYYLDYILNGKFSVSLPVYLREENYDTVKSRIDSIEIVCSPVEKLLGKEIKYGILNLSDIFEYMDDVSFRSLYDHITESTAKGGRMIYWNMMVKRDGRFSDKMVFLDEKSRMLYLKNKTFFYDRFIVEERL